MLQAFKQHIEQRRLLLSDDHVIIATSGGPDSMVLTDLLLQLGMEVDLAHVNFGLRGQDADDDEAFVDNFAQSNNIPVHIRRIDAKTLAKERGMGVQEAARKARYDWFEELRSEIEADVIVTAHHADDATESYLWHIMRGSSLSGFDAIPEASGNVVRPLLRFTKEEILAYAESRKIPFRTDASNVDRKYVRNQIRHDLIPLMRRIRPGFERNVQRQVSMFDEVNFIIDQFVSQLAPGMMILTEEGIELNVEDLAELPFQRLMLGHIGNDYGFPARRVDEMINLLYCKPGKAIYSQSHRIIRERETLVISTIPSGKGDQIATIEFDTEEIHSPVHIQIEKGAKSEFPILGIDWQATLDADKISFPITVRPWHEGDRMRPLGLEGTQLLSDIFTQAKWSQAQKENAWVFESAGEIIWLAGLRIADSVKISDKTEQVIQFSLSDKF
ncbi:MAG: tRNA lysidine(34) synthetase TilS [Flavobacteriales bacterium]|nr:tRNA lysidine(34) synthetase TilS [Flavobacteriales bacterium]